ncbi:MAG: serine/threonine-protein kinase, partial [Thermodesulfobacteriota bacterium]
MAAPKLISRRYEVLEQLGQGGMGTVYKVRHTALGSISALKVLPPELMQEPEMVTRFYREARIMANLSHPNIVRVLDIDHDDALDFHYFVMEYVEGQTLKRYVEQKRSLSLSETLDVAGQVARALAYAHGHAPPIIHRDIKPSNIMIEDRSRRVVVMDFGIAKELDGKELTRPGVTVGTLKYCAPEQMRQEQLDGAVDVYALGMVMYEAFTGKHLYAGLGERELVARVLIEKQENQPAFEKPAPPAFQVLVTRAIAKARETRYPTMASFLRDLETCQGDATPLPARGTGLTGRFRPRLVSSRGDAPRPTELKSEWRDEAATQPAAAGPTPELKRQVDEVRQRTGVLRDATSSVKGRHRDRAERGWRRAERLLEEGRLAEAKTSFEEAATLFSALQSRVGADTSTGGESSRAAPARQLRPDDATVAAPVESEPAPAPAVDAPPRAVVASSSSAPAAPSRAASAGGAAIVTPPPRTTLEPSGSWKLPAAIGAGTL